MKGGFHVPYLSPDRDIGQEDGVHREARHRRAEGLVTCVTKHVCSDIENVIQILKILSGRYLNEGWALAQKGGHVMGLIVRRAT
jgi:hypothetical protein